MILGVILDVIGGQRLVESVRNVIYHSVKQRIVDVYDMKDLTNIRIHIRDCMSKILVKELVIQSRVMTNPLPK